MIVTNIVNPVSFLSGTPENQYLLTALKQLKLHIAAGQLDLKNKPLEDAKDACFTNSYKGTVRQVMQ